MKWDAGENALPRQICRLPQHAHGRGGESERKLPSRSTATDDTLVANTTYTYTVTAQSVQERHERPFRAGALDGQAERQRAAPGNFSSTQIDDVFSAHYKYYNRVPYCGRVVISNNGDSPVQKAQSQLC